MNLDDYKSALQKRMTEEVADDRLSQSTLLASQGQRRPSLVRRIRRNLLLEMGLNILTLLVVGLLLLFQFSSIAERSIGGMLVLIALGFSLFTYLEAKRVGQLINVEGTVLESLQKTLKGLEAFFLRYKRLVAVGTALGFLVGFFAGLQAGREDKVALDEWLDQSWWYDIALLVGIALYVWLIWLFMKWYVHKLYGRHIAELRENLKLLEEELEEPR